MRLFFKHLFRSIRNRPLQPLLLTVILTLAVATSLFAASLDRALKEETNRAQNERYGDAHITVTLDGASKSRFMFVRDAESVLGARAEVAGCLELPMTYGASGQTVFGVATDFTEIGRIFDVSFLAYGKLTPSVVGDAAFVSASFAADNGLSLGDAFTVKVFGSEKVYTVAGISPQRFIESYDIMVDNSGIASILAKDSLLLSSMKDGFRPCSTLYIKVLGMSDKAEAGKGFKKEDLQAISSASALLASAPIFEEKTVSEVYLSVARGNNSEALSWVVTIAILLSCLLAAAVVFSCLYILSVERSEENRSFMLSGARASRLHALQYAEISLYLVCASVLGVLLTAPAFAAFVSSAHFRYAASDLHVADMIASVAFVFLVGILTVTFFAASEPMLRKPKKEKKHALLWHLLPLMLTVLSVAAVYLLPVRLRHFCFIPLVLTFTVSIFIYAPKVLRKWMAATDARLSRKLENSAGITHPALYYAVKNTVTVKMLHNTARLIALLGFAVFSALLLMMSSVGHLRFAKDVFKAEYAVMGATENCYLGVRNAQGVEDCYRVYMQTAETVEGKPLLVLGTDDMQAFAEGQRPEHAPKGNLAAISRGDAKWSHVRVGDTLRLNVGGKSIDVVISQLLDSTVNAVIIDNEHFDLHYNMIFVNPMPQANTASMLSEISENTKNELATVVRMRDFWASRMDALEIYLAAGLVILGVIFAFAVIATADNLGQSYRMRREEFVLYRLSGMSRGQVARMKLYEISIALLFGLLFAAAATAALFVPTCAALRSYGYEEMLGIRYFLRFGFP